MDLSSCSNSFLLLEFIWPRTYLVIRIWLCSSDYSLFEFIRLFPSLKFIFSSFLSPTRFWLLPQPILKRRIMGKRALDSSTDKSIQDSIEFMNLSLESLTQKELASRLTLNCSNSYVKPQRLKDIHITIIDVSCRTGAAVSTRTSFYKNFQTLEVSTFVEVSV